MKKFQIFISCRSTGPISTKIITTLNLVKGLYHFPRGNHIEEFFLRFHQNLVRNILWAKGFKLVTNERPCSIQMGHDSETSENTLTTFTFTF